ncbi:hypothetical protein DXG01_000909, partial [Tephrocybe rancida]
AGAGEYGQIRLPDNEAAKLMADHVPASLHFSFLTYALRPRVTLDNISGSVKPGQVMAIMGASGASKSTLLDMLVRKGKCGVVSGTTLVNGREVAKAGFKGVMGFVDQEDTLMSTLTVYETVLYSALLRLPRDMSYETKKYRTLETMNELGILGIKDSRIGETGKRSISGGEKRRVSITYELVTSPSILFLNKPTSGLDAFNAFNVVESLVSLARNYNHTVIFTIHQPRSNIVAMFDQLVLLASGKLAYSGEFAKCHDYFTLIGQPCPPGFNIADFLIDLTMHATLDTGLNSDASTSHESLIEDESTSPSTNLGEEELGLPTARPRSGCNSSSPPEEQTHLCSHANSIASSTERYLKHKTSQLLEAVTTPATGPNKPISAKLTVLVDADELRRQAVLSDNGQAEIAEGADGVVNGLPDVVLETSLLGRKRASYGTQFKILSGRVFKNLYRDPALLTAHYLSSIVLACIFFFTLALLGFSCLSSLGLFANERILFMCERANGYHSSFIYFSSKILFDIPPLKLVPPLMFGSIVYLLVGLVPIVPGFWKFMLTLPVDTSPDYSEQPEPPKRSSVLIEEDDPEDDRDKDNQYPRFPHALGTPVNGGSHSPSPTRASPYLSQRTPPVNEDDEDEVLYPPYRHPDDFEQELSWVAEPVPTYDSDPEKQMPIRGNNDQDEDQPPLSSHSSNGFSAAEHDDYAFRHASFSSRSLIVESETLPASPSHASLTPLTPHQESVTHTNDGSTSPLTYPKGLSVGLPSPDWGDLNGDNPSTWEKVIGAFSRTGSSSEQRSCMNSFINRNRADSVNRESGASLNSAKTDKVDAPQQAQPLMQSPSASASISSLAAHA